MEKLTLALETKCLIMQLQNRDAILYKYVSWLTWIITNSDMSADCLPCLSPPIDPTTRVQGYHSIGRPAGSLIVETVNWRDIQLRKRS